MKGKLLVLPISLITYVVMGQESVGERVVNRTKETTIRKTEDKIDEKVDNTLDKVFDGSIFKKKKKKSGDGNASTAKKSSRKQSSGGSNASDDDDTDFSSYRDFDFVPGTQTLFFEDFSNSSLGSGATQWTVTGNKGEPAITTIPGSENRWLRTPMEGLSFPNAFNDFPEEFTLEFDMYADPATMNEMMSGLKVGIVKKMADRSEYDQWFSSEPEITLDIHPSGEKGALNLRAVTEYNGNLTQEEMTLHDSTNRDGWLNGEVNRISIARNGKAIALYVNETKYIDLPNGLPKPGPYGLVFANNMWGDGTYLTNVRVGGGGAVTAKTVNKEIATEKKFISRTIYFDVNSARIKPESWATLNEIANAIGGMPGNFHIVGHTDSDGAEAANLTLSIRRAASVKNALVGEFGLDGARLTTDGKGETEPVESNETIAGKAQNRRVEFIQQ
ncbi:hypothetical protein GCM10007415_35110 [Parapedobacter pyrenivorans]|uniref:OmpA-like domain-containing protein n=1 Tax=Parapedobacter pyrenivorans TaxID=1305674 RepID=A0A917HYZ7_9SPHI|nr:OmpA family protein [Parapedobacter pyrenivorans]GGG96813.1 hypothetical protein GCM10007415_35110 [Parapedobacter pyrenivorans]